MRQAALLSLLLLIVAGCQTPTEAPVETSTVSPTAAVTTRGVAARRDDARGFDYVFYPGEPMRHAYRDPKVRPQAKADGDEVRYAYPERYAITEPPGPDVRSMVEWEPMESVVMQVPDYITNYDGVMGTIQGIGVNAITVAEVWYVIESNGTKNIIKDMLYEAGVSASTVNAKTRWLITPLESIWFIDSGPLPIIDPASNTYAFADFRYYEDRSRDDGVPTLLGRSLTEMGEPSNTETYRMPINTEGG
ncbi:MAG: hypothetical protein QF464_10805, partial [Myxococcota bacterium]|nr:hypothetical protein [Myxococcota bacterium]